jgi:hypothetical protein
MKGLRYAILMTFLVALGGWNRAPSSDAKDFDSVAHHKNVEVAGYSDLNGRPAFKMAIQKVGHKWYLYTANMWHRGWTITDVTNPRKPYVVKYMPGPSHTWTIQLDIADGIMVTSLEKMAAGWEMPGEDPNSPFDEGVLIWDVSNPTNPQQLGQFKTGGTGTHRNFYGGGRYVHLAAGMPGYTGNIYVIIDIGNPTNPVEVSRWWVPGQHVAGGETPSEPFVSLHGPPYVVGNLVYLPYYSAGLIILDISDITHPKQVGRLDFSPPFVSFIGGHTALPLPERNLVFFNSEVIQPRCNEPLGHASLVDISDVTKPVLISTMPVPVPPHGAPYPNFCEKGGRFGPHNVHDLFHSPFTQHRDDLMYVTYENAGLRIFDISDPRLPTEVGYFIPPNPTQRIGPKPENDLVAESEVVIADARGYIYVNDKNEGVWILRYTGSNREDRSNDGRN